MECTRDQVFSYLPERHSVPIQEPFEDRTAVPVNWRQRFAAWLCKKTQLKFLRSKFETTYSPIHINGEDLIRSLLKYQWQIEECFNAEIDRIICGPGDVQHFIDAARINGPLDFTFQTPLCSGSQLKIRGITVQIIPWIEGITIIPKLQRDL